MTNDYQHLNHIKAERRQSLKQYDSNVRHRADLPKSSKRNTLAVVTVIILAVMLFSWLVIF